MINLSINETNSDYEKKILDKYNSVSVIKKTIYYFLKRVFDIVCSLFALICFFPFLLIFAVLIKLESLGPVFFKQQRVGKNNTIFIMYKFRTITSSGDITKIGKFLRQTALVQIPQIFNVLIGDMSFIGPRPMGINEHHLLSKYHALFQICKPGLAGVSIKFLNNPEFDIDKLMEQEIAYALDCSILTDLKIFFYYNVKFTFFS